MERPTPWSRIVVEGFVIVIGILLPFGIDAWWEGKQELRAGRELVAAVATEAAANRVLIESMWVPNTYELEQGAFSAATSAEEVGLIRNGRLRFALANGRSTSR